MQQPSHLNIIIHIAIQGRILLFVTVTSMKTMDIPATKDAMMESLYDSERKFRKACVQVTMINKQLDDCRERYSRAKADGYRSFRYNLRVKLAVMEGVRNMYYDYAYMKAEDVAPTKTRPVWGGARHCRLGRGYRRRRLKESLTNTNGPFQGHNGSLQSQHNC